VVASIVGTSGFPGVGLALETSSSPLASTILAYSVFAQTLLGFVCLNSWRRRVERGHASLFRPIEGVLLALVSIGCSALGLLDLSARANAQDFDSLNVLTFVSCIFLLPLLGWLLVSSLRRPARANAVTGPREALRAFVRFQGFLAVTIALVGLAYAVVVSHTGLVNENSEIMWATLAQVLLVAETGVATLLWASRRRDGKLRTFFLGGSVVVLQLAMTALVYGHEVEHVARHNAAAMPLLLGSDLSPYWFAFLVILWVAGISIVVASLLRSRDQAQAEEETRLDEHEDDESGMPGRRLIH
jgi:heme/copper-type cytochrome/quinol oxidase subunit 2